jgi:hypothetical protein
MEPEVAQLNFRIEYTVAVYGVQHFGFARPNRTEGMKRFEDFWQMVITTPYWTSPSTGRTISTPITSATLYLLVLNKVTMQTIKYPLVTRTRHDFDNSTTDYLWR